MEYSLTELTSYDQVRKGDFYPNAFDVSVVSNGFTIGVVNEVSGDYVRGNAGLFGNFIVKGNLKGLIFLRQEQGKLEILAGEHAFKKLDKPDNTFSQSQPKCTEEVLKEARDKAVGE